MTTRYVGIGGNDGNSGLTWALRKLTLNGAEDTPVVANDIVYVGPGAYRELLTVDVSGGAGTEIVYIGDVTGEHTDGIGGVVRITGSDNDTAAARASCILDGGGFDYRTFRGFRLDTTSSYNISAPGACTNWTIEDCVFEIGASYAIRVFDDAHADWVINRCLFHGVKGGQYAIFIGSTAGIANAGHLVENCVFISGYGRAVGCDDVGGITIRNTLFSGGFWAVVVIDALPGGYTAIDVNNCIFAYCGTGVRAINLGELVEDFNTFWANTTDRTTVNVGGNSLTYPPLFNYPLLHSGASQASGFKFPWWFGELSEWSQIAAITGSNEPSIDFHGIPRPATASKNSWGPHQFRDMELESTTVQAGTYARTLLDAGDVLVRRVPHDNTAITVTLYMRYGNTYAGNLPQMIIKQPGQADNTDTMVAAADNWEQLSIAFTPAAQPGFFEVWAKSRNTAAKAATTRVIYDTFDVS